MGIARLMPKAEESKGGKRSGVCPGARFWGQAHRLAVVVTAPDCPLGGQRSTRFADRMDRFLPCDEAVATAGESTSQR